MGVRGRVFGEKFISSGAIWRGKAGKRKRGFNAKAPRHSAAKAPTKRFGQEQTEQTEEDKARPQKTVHLLSVSSVCSCDNFPAKSFFFAFREFNTVLSCIPYLSYMKLLGIPVGLLINFHEMKLVDGIHRMILPGANQ